MGRNDNNAKAVGAGEVPKAQQVSKPRMSTEEKVERLLQEINMLNLERFLFSTDRQNAAGAHTERIFTDSEGRKYTFAFGKFGQPGEVAYRVFHAGTHHFVESARMCDGNACHFRPLAAISKRRLAALCGRSWSGGKDDNDYHEAIMSLTTTMVTVEWYDKKTDTTQWQTFNPFSSAFFASKGNLTQSAAGAKGFESCVYSVNPHILENYSAGYFRAFNIQRLMMLRCTGQMLYKRLFLAFGYLHKQKGVRKFEKDYEIICADWLGQPARIYLSKITKHLGQHLDDLVTVGLLKNYKIELKARGKGFKIVFFPGDGFYADYELYLQTVAAQLPMRAPDVGDDEPAKLVGYFHTKLGRTHGEFRPQELAQARELLNTYSPAEVQDLVDYALEQKAKNVLPQVFGFVVGYRVQWAEIKAKRLQDREWRRLTVACTLCDAAGFFRFIPGNTSSKLEVRIQACPHDRGKVERWASEYGHVVQPPEAPVKP